jgi:hypothetical protein
MKQLYLIGFICSLSLLACKKDSDKDNNNSNNDTYYLTAAIDGKEVKFILPVCDTTSSFADITVYAFTDSTQKEYLWFDIDNAVVGTEKFARIGYVDYSANTGADPYIGAQESNTVTVSNIDKDLVQGTFSGTASSRRQDPNTGVVSIYQTMKITNGKFRLQLGKR